MITLGLTVKQIRLDKGFSQKEIYSGIVSRSFATRFEHGQHDIAATKLFAILDNLGVSVDEYRFIAQHYQSSPLDQALLITTQAYYDQNFTFLTNWVRDHQHSPKAYERLVASYTSIRLIAFDHRQMPLTTAIQPAYQHLRQTKTWTVQELKLANLLPALVASDAGIAALADFTLKMVQNCHRYQTTLGDPFHVLTALIDYYGAVLQTYLNWREFDYARALAPKFQALEPTRLTWDGRLGRQFWLAIWALYFGDAIAGQATLKKLMAVERLHQPIIDTNLRTIIHVRQLEAQAYRAGKLN